MGLLRSTELLLLVFLWTGGIRELLQEREGQGLQPPLLLAALQQLLAVKVALVRCGGCWRRWVGWRSS